MSVDTRNKRMSMLGIGLDALRVRPNPDGTIAAADRVHFLPLYAGILPTAPLFPPSSGHRSRKVVSHAIWNRWRLLKHSDEAL